MVPMKQSIARELIRTRVWLNRASHLLDLGLRLYLAKVFFWSGLTKIMSWDDTLTLFQDEYRVPLLPPEVAAVLGTFGELFFPVLLALGLAGRFAAAGLFFVNLMAVVSYWHVLSGAGAALAQHWYWGSLLLVVALHGPGGLSFDAVVWRRWLPGLSV